MARLPRAAGLALGVLLAGPAAAQKAPEMGYAFPAGGRIGSTVSLALGGYDWTPDMDILVHHPRVRLEITAPPGPILVPPPPYWFGPKSFSEAAPLPREFPARLVLPPDLPEGPIRWQAANANGVTATGVLYASRIPEVAEQRARRSEAQSLATIPTVVNGRLDRIEQVDAYRIRTSTTGPVSVEAWARRLGSPFYACIQVVDRRGRPVADVSDTEGRDPVLTFAARAGEEYEVRVHDLDFAGDFGFVYRLLIAPGPRTLVRLPRERGPSAGPARLVQDWGEGAPRETPEADGEDGKEWTVAPDASPGIRAGEAVVRRWNPGQRTQAATLTGSKGDHFSARVRAASIGSPLDPALSLLGSDGREIASNDDLPGTTDAGLEFTLPADGTYTLRVREMSGRGGPAAITRLSLDAVTPGFEVQAQAQGISVSPGASAPLAVRIRRYGGFSGAVTLTAEGLPASVTCSPLTLAPSQAAGSLTFACAKETGTGLHPLRIIGTSGALNAAARAPAGGDLAPRDPADAGTDRLALAVTLPPRFKLEPVDKDGGRTVNRGTTYPAEVLVQREAGFAQEVHLWMAARQARVRMGITGPEVTVPPGVSRIAYPCFMPEWLETSRTSRMILVGVALVEDVRGRVRHVMAPMDGRITMSIEGALLGLAHDRAERSVSPGGTLRVPLTVARSPLLPGPARVEFAGLDDPPAGAPADVVTADAVVLPPGAERGEVAIRFSAHPSLTGRHEAILRCTVLQPNGLPAVAETRVPVEVGLR